MKADGLRRAPIVPLQFAGNSCGVRQSAQFLTEFFRGMGKISAGIGPERRGV
jgi:hypothetical protein